jgi:hypothetical protein
MEPHVQRIADAARQALDVLGEQDRIAIMVFDTRARERLPFTNGRAEVTRELNHLVRSEGFNGGTRITSALIDAASYVQRHARADARRAVVILTDDETQDAEDEPRVEKALARANAVLSFLQAPYEPPTMSGGRGPQQRRGGGMGWPGGGGGWPGGGSRWPGGGGGWPGGGGGGPVILGPGGNGGAMDRSHSAGTETIAHDSGGDTMPVSDASALEDTLARLRQRYALHYYLTDGAQDQSRHDIRVDLSSEARIRFHDAEVRSRRVFMAGGSDSESSGPTVVTRQTAPAEPMPIDDSNQPTLKRRRVAVNEDSAGPAVNTVDTPANTRSAETPARGGWPRVDTTTAKPNN